LILLLSYKNTFPLLILESRFCRLRKELPFFQTIPNQPLFYSTSVSLVFSYFNLLKVSPKFYLVPDRWHWSTWSKFQCKLASTVKGTVYKKTKPLEYVWLCSIYIINKRTHLVFNVFYTFSSFWRQQQECEECLC
jgi:hypothetical protein